MKINVRPRRRNAPRPAEKSCPAFLKWLRGRECVWGQIDAPCGGKIEAQHLDFAGDKGTGTKVSDRYCLPSCSRHHRTQHEMGWPRFLASREVTKELALEAADNFWRSWPGRIAWERKLEADK